LHQQLDFQAFPLLPSKQLTFPGPSVVLEVEQWLQPKTQLPSWLWRHLSTFIFLIWLVPPKLVKGPKEQPLGLVKFEELQLALELNIRR